MKNLIENLLPPFFNVHESYRSVFNSKDGQIVLRHLMHNCYMNNSTYAPGDPDETIHREGQRRVILGILKKLNMSTGDIQDKLQETDDENANFIRAGR